MLGKRAHELSAPQIPRFLDYVSQRALGHEPISLVGSCMLGDALSARRFFFFSKLWFPGDAVRS